MVELHETGILDEYLSPPEEQHWRRSATKALQISELARLVGVSRALDTDSREGTPSRTQAPLSLENPDVASTLLRPPHSIIPATTLEDLEMICRAYHVVVPQYSPAIGASQSETLLSAAPIRNEADGNSERRLRALLASRRRDVGTLSDTCSHKYLVTSPSQTSISGPVCEEHVFADISLELEQTRNDLQRHVQLLEIERRRTKFLLEELHFLRFHRRMEMAKRGNVEIPSPPSPLEVELFPDTNESAVDAILRQEMIEEHIRRRHPNRLLSANRHKTNHTKPCDVAQKPDEQDTPAAVRTMYLRGKQLASLDRSPPKEETPEIYIPTSSPSGAELQLTPQHRSLRHGRQLHTYVRGDTAKKIRNLSARSVWPISSARGQPEESVIVPLGVDVRCVPRSPSSSAIVQPTIHSPPPSIHKHLGVVAKHYASVPA
jgi:hypothetical protein